MPSSLGVPIGGGRVSNLWDSRRRGTVWVVKIGQMETSRREAVFPRCCERRSHPPPPRGEVSRTGLTLCDRSSGQSCQSPTVWVA